jgi:hypothetical protein
MAKPQLSKKAKIRLIGTPEQRRRAFAAKQKAHIASLPTSERAILKKAGFTAGLQIVRPVSGAPGAAGFPAQTGAAFRAREGYRHARTGFVAGSYWRGGYSRLIGTRGEQLARHEITHQVLAPKGLTFKQEHVIIAAQEPAKQKKVSGLAPARVTKATKEKRRALQRFRRKLETRR